MLPVEIDGETHYACPVEGCTAMGWEFDIFPMVDDENSNGHWVDDEELDDEEWSEDIASPDSIFQSPADSFEPPREWTPEADLEDEDELMEDEIDEAIYFSREDLERLKQSGEVDRRIKEIQNSWRARAEEQLKHDSCDHLWQGKDFKDEDIPF